MQRGRALGNGMNRDEIIAGNPLENYLTRIGVYLRRSRNGYLCRCPLGGHEDHHPSFQVRNERWTCWSHPGGMTSGTIIDLVMAIEGLSCGEAMRKLQRRY